MVKIVLLCVQVLGMKWSILLKNRESAYFVMLSNGKLIHIAPIGKDVDIDKEYGDECVVLTISSFEDIS